MEGILKMSTKEVDRFAILKQTLEKKITQKEAGRILRISDRQVRNLLSEINTKGPEGVISKKRGRPGNNKKPEDLRKRIIVLLRTKYDGFGPTLASEKLEELEGIKISAESLRLWMIEEKIWFPKQRKIKTHPPRERRPCFGELIQVDGSHHRWFGEDGPKLTLLVFIDDATSAITAMHLCKEETLNDYFITLEQHLKQYGIPRAVYSDRLKVFQGEKNLSQFQQAAKALDITPILANSPQAKGKVERVNRTLQDRFLKELKLRGINTIEEANKFIPEYLEKHNNKFSKEPARKVDANRPLEKDHDLDRLLCRREERTLTKDFIFQYSNRFYKIDETPEIKRPKGRKIEIRITRSGNMRVFLGKTELGFKPLDQIIEKAPEMNRKEVLAWQSKETKSAPKDHPWKSSRQNAA